MCPTTVHTVDHASLAQLVERALRTIEEHFLGSDYNARVHLLPKVHFYSRIVES
jgi:hypothetical protein